MATPTQTTTTTSSGLKGHTHSNALKVKTHVKAGCCVGCGGGSNHNETLVQAPRPATGLKVKTHVKAGVTIRPGILPR
jgi:hypothetical protein